MTESIRARSPAIEIVTGMTTVAGSAGGTGEVTGAPGPTAGDGTSKWREHAPTVAATTNVLKRRRAFRLQLRTRDVLLTTMFNLTLFLWTLEVRYESPAQG